jgi:hypothetical protein
MLGWGAIPQIIIGAIGMLAIGLIMLSESKLADAVAGILFGIIGILAWYVFGLWSIASAFVAALGTWLLIDGAKRCTARREGTRLSQGHLP